MHWVAFGGYLICTVHGIAGRYRYENGEYICFLVLRQEAQPPFIIGVWSPNTLSSCILGSLVRVSWSHFVRLQRPLLCPSALFPGFIGKCKPTFEMEYLAFTRDSDFFYGEVGFSKSLSTFSHPVLSTSATCPLLFRGLKSKTMVHFLFNLFIGFMCRYR